MVSNSEKNEAKIVFVSIDNTSSLIRYGINLSLKDLLPKKAPKKQPEQYDDPESSYENAIVQRANDFLSPVDKVSKKIFDTRDNAVFYDKEGVLVNVGKKGNKQIDTIVSINIDDFKNITISNDAMLSPYNRAVHDAIISLYVAGNTHLTINMIYKVMRGNNPSKDAPEEKTRQDITASIEKIMHSIITIDATEEAKAFGFEEFHFQGQLLPIQYTTAKINGQVVDCIKIIAEPPLLKYANRKNQINRCDVKLLDVPLNSTSDNVIIKNYLLEQVSSMKSEKSKIKNIIRYETIYEYLGIEASKDASLKKKKMEIRSKVHIILEAWKKTGFILGFADIKEGKNIAKVEIFLPKKGRFV